MNEEKPERPMAEFNNFNGSQRRRSPRLSSPPQAKANLKSDNKTAKTSLAVKRSITVRKVAPRKTVAPLEHNKENTPSRSGTECVQQKPNVSTPGPGAGLGVSSTKKRAYMPSPITPSSPPPPPSSRPEAPPVDPEDALWTQKVRRSYSRLSDKSLSSPDSRETMFGFDKMKTPEVGQRVKTRLEVSGGSLSGLSPFSSLLEADNCGTALPEPDTNIPGVALVKERRRRRRKVQQIDATELDAMAAKMNAEFEEAAVFELVVE